MKKNNLLLMIIIIMAVLLRFWGLSNIPPSLSHDEVAIGYNAWSILQTGKDEYGTSFPILFRSFEDYKLPGYIYLTVISEKFFGLNEFAVRFPSAFLGSLTVLVFYHLIKEILRRLNKAQDVEIIALISAFILAISPWHINFSRAAFESNGSLFFIISGVFLLFKGIEKIEFMLLSAVSFVISLYFYYTARIIIPFIVLSFIVIYYKEFIKEKKWIIMSFLLALILLLPLISQMFTTGLSRVNQISIFQDKSLTNPYSEAIVRNNNSIYAKIFYNRRLAYLQEFCDNYLKNFALDFYFTNGTGPHGLLYLWEIPFFFLGIYIVCKKKEKGKWIIIIWFLTVPLTGGLTTGQPNALRTLANVPMTAFFSAIGFWYIIKILKAKKYFLIYLSFSFGIMIFFFLRFLNLYFDYNANLSAMNWGDGHKQMAAFVKVNKFKYDIIYISGNYWRPYIYLLFYMQYPPDKYQKYGSMIKIENIYFGQASWDKGDAINLAQADLSKLSKKQTLFILSSSDLQSQNSLIKSEERLYNWTIFKKIDGNMQEEVFHVVKLR